MGHNAPSTPGVTDAMSTAALLNSLYRHKAWTNEELYAEVARIDGAKHPEARHSAIRLLNHIYVVDRIFASHLQGVPHGYDATNTKETPELEALAADAKACDRWYVDYTAGVDDAALAEPVSFTFTDGLAGRMTRGEMLAHIVTHGSYHRGGVGRMLVSAERSPPRDLLTIHLHRTEPARREVR